MDKIDKPFRLLVATGNQGKIRELRGLLSDLPIELMGLNEIDGIIEIDETGATFRENAGLKATGYARQTGLWALADDSGLEVKSIGGAPGVQSARYAGTNTGYDVKIGTLLKQIDAVGGSDRRARFVCAMALADPEGTILYTAEGICEGRIARGPRGTFGFGYDPVFIPDGFDLTFGELRDDIKQQISHRARASAQIMRYLRDFIDV
jgi:XTP/dITP diphosphohydrolase